MNTLHLDPFSIPPTTREEWSKQISRDGRTVAHAYAYNRRLPANFTFWDICIAEQGETVAHTAAYYECLPPDFDQWELADKRGWTVAHAAAAKRHVFPPDSPYWDLKAADGTTVRQIYQRWSKTKPGSSSGVSISSKSTEVIADPIKGLVIMAASHRLSKAVQRGITEAIQSLLADAPLSEVVERVEVLVEKEIAEYRLLIHQLTLENSALKQINKTKDSL